MSEGVPREEDNMQTHDDLDALKTACLARTTPDVLGDPEFGGSKKLLEFFANPDVSMMEKEAKLENLLFASYVHALGDGVLIAGGEVVEPTEVESEALRTILTYYDEAVLEHLDEIETENGEDNAG